MKKCHKKGSILNASNSSKNFVKQNITSLFRRYNAIESFIFNLGRKISIINQSCTIEFCKLVTQCVGFIQHFHHDINCYYFSTSPFLLILKYDLEK